MIIKYKKFIRFVIVAATYNLIGYAFFSGLIYIGINYIIASLLSFIFGVTLGFFMNKNLVFAVKKNNNKLVVKYTIFYLVLLAINLLFLHFFVKTLNLSPYLSQIIVTVIAAIVSYNTMRVCIFRW